MERLIVTPTAVRAASRLLGGSPGGSAGRVERKPGACGWPAFGLRIDRARDDDSIQLHGGVAWVVERALLEEAGAIAIDHVSGGPGEQFSITSDHLLSATCLGCSTRCRDNLGKAEDVGDTR